MKLPDHKCSLTITHNEHKDYYQSVKDWLADSGDSFNWADESAMQRTLETGEIWVIQWYPDTPIGSYAVAAPTLQEALDLSTSINPNT